MKAKKRVGISQVTPATPVLLAKPKRSCKCVPKVKIPVEVPVSEKAQAPTPSLFKRFLAWF